MKGKITIADIAKKSNCSISTVSKALSDSSDLNLKTKEEIRKCALQMGYEIGRKKANSKGTIAVIIQGSNYSEISFEYQMLFGFKLNATRNNYDVEIVNKDSDDHNWSFTNEVANKNYMGAFILRLGDADKVFAEVNNSKMPIVVFDNEIESKNSAYIGCDNSLGIKLAVEHLVSLGHEKIAFYGGTPTAQVSMIRKKSFINSLYNYGLKAYPELIAESSFSQNYASKIIPEFVSHGATGIVCSSDLLAVNCINELKKLGLDVPNDVSVVGFDNVPLAEGTKPALTTIDQNIKEIGNNAFYLLDRLINNVTISRILFRPELIARESTAKVKK